MPETFAVTDRRIAESRAGAQDGAKLRLPDLGGQPDVDEARLYRGNREPAAAVIAGRELTPAKGSGDPLREDHGVGIDHPGEVSVRVGEPVRRRGQPATGAGRAKRRRDEQPEVRIVALGGEIGP